MAHLSAFVAAFVLLAFLGPLVVWLVKRDEDAFVAYHAKEALNFNLSFLLYGTVLMVLTLATFGVGAIVTVPALIVGGIAWIVLPILAAVAANEGRSYRYPLTIRFVA